MNNKGQSLIDVIFAIGIIVLVLTGVSILVVSTTRIKTVSLERNRAVELSQLLIEKKVLEIKKDFSFWESVSDFDSTTGNNGSSIDSKFSRYTYDMQYKDCDVNSCKVIFTIRWGNAKNLSVERLFLKNGI